MTKTSAKCKLCNCTLSVPRASTTNLHKHAKKAHKPEYDESQLNQPSKVSQPKMTFFLNKPPFYPTTCSRKKQLDNTVILFF